MVSSRKRGRHEMEAVEPPTEQSLLERIRNMWEFANLAQWIFIFGRAVKIDENIDVEELEMECLKTTSAVLPDVGLALLKFVSSHRGLTPELFDEYTRRQYVSKAPDRNPFGTEEEPANFNEFDIFTKIRVLQQLTQWTMGNPDRIRERMDEQKDTEQTLWRIEPFGWDSQDRTYFVLDDNRLYRRTDPSPPPPSAPKPKKNSKKAKAALRASKRRKISQPAGNEDEPAEEDNNDELDKSDKELDHLGGMIWECVAVTLDEYNDFIASIEKSRDLNEKTLRKRTLEGVLPLLEKQEEARKRKQAQKERELLNLEKLASAKRSSRIAGKLEQQKQEEEVREAERKKQAELVMAKKEQEKWLKLEKERESRMMTREQRLKEREARRILHEEELANLSEDSRKLETGEGRLSERHLKAEIERKKKALEELTEEEDWIFDCICGAYGQIDDGTHSIACDKCNIWQHSKCVGVSQAEADRADFHFICKTCERRARDAERAKTHPPIKIKLNRPGSSSSPAAPKPSITPAVVVKLNGSTGLPSSLQEGGGQTSQKESTRPTLLAKSSGPEVVTWHPGTSSPPGDFRRSSPGYTVSPTYSQSNGQQMSPQHRTGSALPTATRAYSGPYGPSTNNGTTVMPPYGASRPLSAHAFSSPHPHSPTSLPAPGQPQAYTFVNAHSSPYINSVSNVPRSNKTPSQYNGIRLPSAQESSPVLPANQSYGPPPSASTANVPRPGSSDSAHPRSSINLLPPRVGAPVLIPSTQANPTATLLASTSSPVMHRTPNADPSVSSPPHKLSSNPKTVPPLAQQISSQASVLPPAAIGISPTKHSPPRPSTSNGSFGSATPSILPPVTSLPPGAQLQDLTPPVKSSDPDRNKLIVQLAQSVSMPSEIVGQPNHSPSV